MDKGGGLGAGVCVSVCVCVGEDIVGSRGIVIGGEEGAEVWWEGVFVGLGGWGYGTGGYCAAVHVRPANVVRIQYIHDPTPIS